LATHNGNTVTLDAAGNTTADIAENLSFTYDDHNRMVEAYVGAVLQASYVYNGQGQRVKKVEATGAERTFVFHYGLGGELLGETVYDDVGAKIEERDYLWPDTLPVAQSERAFSGSTVTSSQFVYLHADQLDTPRLATNGSGTVVWRWDSDAFGTGAANLDPDADTNEVNVRLRFPGQYLDAETGLHYNYFRDYDPVTGRYVESDPIGLAGGLNTYAYVEANPLTHMDERGLQRGSLPRYQELRNFLEDVRRLIKPRPLSGNCIFGWTYTYVWRCPNPSYNPEDLICKQDDDDPYLTIKTSEYRAPRLRCSPAGREPLHFGLICRK
jgi:RHS repeat-associated protein